MAPPRTPEVVVSELEREREELARAVSSLRSELGEATDLRRLLRTKWPILAAAGSVAAVAIAGALILRRGRERPPVVLARIGRLAIIERND